MVPRLQRATLALIAITNVAHADAVSPITEAAEQAANASAEYKAGHFKQAIIDYKTAYELDPKDEYLLGWAQSLRRDGDCPGAVVLYRKLLAMPLPPKRIAFVRLAMSECPTEPAPTTTKRIEDPWYRDWTAHAFVGGGAIALGLGTWATIVSVGDERDAREAETYGEHVRLTDRAEVLRVIGISGLAIGAVSAAIGIVLYRRHEDRIEQVPVTGWIDRDGGGITARFAW